MNLAIPATRSALGTGSGEYRWEDVMMELLPLITSPLSPDAERLLLEVLRFDGRLRLVVSYDMPHSMPPTEMLKSLAVQAIAKWTGLDHLHDMLKVQRTTASSSLASLVGDVIRKTREELSPVAKRDIPKEGIEEVAETSPLEARKTIRRPIAKERGMAYLPGIRIRTRSWQREPAMAG
jgi:hypothetical protein